jgi:cytochrome c biogenesis protein CcmG/thiol:disulfide interchange protein DsbE
MSRGWRIIPLILLLWLVTGLAWRLVKPGDPAIPSLMVNRPLPTFALDPALPGKPGLTSADLATGQPHLLNVFASWCVPCVGEVSVLGELRQRGVKIDGIAVRDRPDAIAAFLARNGDPYERVGADPRSSVQISLGSSGVPETFVIDGKGTIRHQYIGPLSRANIAGVMDQLKALQ